MHFSFGYRTADLSLRHLSFERAHRHISCSVPIGEWHSTQDKICCMFCVIKNSLIPTDTKFTPPPKKKKKKIQESG